MGQVEVLAAARRNRSKALSAKLVLDEKAGKVKLDFGVGPVGGDARKYFGQVTSVTRRFSIVDWDLATGRA